ncbi:LysE family transporter [Desulfocurvus sp. DL9XJH121]
MMEFLGVSLFILLAAMAPGPDFAVVMKNSLLHDRKAALFTALGIGAGLTVHTAYSLLGLAVVISKSILVFTVVKYLGAAYLCYLGLRSLLERRGQAPRLAPGAEPSKLPVREALRQGFLCNLLNPKAPLFYIAFFSVIIPPQATHTVKFLYGAESVAVVTGWFVFLAFAATGHAVRAALSRAQAVLTKLLGGMMLYFGIRLALAQR